MTKKIITVFGATGAQGGGLARAILADKDSEFALRAVTRKPDSEAAKALAAAGARDRGGRHGRCRQRAACDGGRVRRLLRHELLGTLFAGQGTGAGQGDGRWRGSRRAEARDLVDAGGHARVLSGRWQAHAGADGQVQRAALRRQGRGQQVLHRARADDAAQHVVLLGQPDPLRHGPEEGTGRRAGVHVADGRQEAARHRRRGHRQVRLRHLQGRRRERRQDLRDRRRAPDRLRRWPRR